MELNSSVEHLRSSVEQVEQRNKALKKIAHLQSHEIREPLTSIMGVMNIMREDDDLYNHQYFNTLRVQ
jgi:signal transduction histidine kinase